MKKLKRHSKNNHLIFFQCFGGYWNEVALSADGWGTHISASCQIQVRLLFSFLVNNFNLSQGLDFKYFKLFSFITLNKIGNF